MRILIIEDDHKIAGAIKRGFEQERFAVDVSYDGKDGLASALTQSYDLLILDRMLPEIDGMQISIALRKQNINIPIIFLTAKDTVMDRVDGLNSGADDYMVKPFAFEELLARVKALLRRPSAIERETLKVDDLTLDTRTYEVKRDGKVVLLSKKEYAILEYLMRNQGRILTKDNIIEHVWDYDADILRNTVEVFIGNLRNKIDKPFAKKSNIITTVRGFGYRIGCPK